ncbi:MAG: M12 family metallo-peptidase [Methanocorpusculum sp.]|nr:M12 family metallo-peptidase [Methanocorpusculum sp.]
MTILISCSSSLFIFSNYNSANQNTYVNLLVVADNEFYTLEANWIGCAQDYIAEANYQFQRVDLRIFLGATYDASKRHLLSNHVDHDTAPLDTVKTYYTPEFLDSFGSDICVYLGGTDIVGTAQGYAWLFGTEGVVPRYTWSQMVDDADTPDLYDGSRYSRVYCVIHELGHVFGADHDQAMRFKTLNRDYKYTVMYGMYMGSYSAGLEFSPPLVYIITGDNMFIGNNVARINENKVDVGNFAF